MDINLIALRVSEYLGPILALMLLLASLAEAASKTFKPITNLIKWIKKRFGSDVDEKLDKLSANIGEVKNMTIEWGHCLQEILADNIRQDEKQEKMQSQILENEKSRLSEYLFRLGHVLRTGGRITDREFQQVQESYYKYHDELHGNGRVTDEYNYIKDKYNAGLPAQDIGGIDDERN